MEIEARNANGTEAVDTMSRWSDHAEALQAFIVNGFRRRPRPVVGTTIEATARGSAAGIDPFLIQPAFDWTSLVPAEALSERATRTLEALRGLSDIERLELGRWLLTQRDPAWRSGWRFRHSTGTMKRPRGGAPVLATAMGTLFSNATGRSWHYDDSVPEDEWDYEIARDGNPLRPREAAERLLVFGWMLGVAFSSRDEDKIDALLALASPRLTFLAEFNEA